jgi:hypothetical protein
MAHRRAGGQVVEYLKFSMKVDDEDTGDDHCDGGDETTLPYTNVITTIITPAAFLCANHIFTLILLDFSIRSFGNPVCLRISSTHLCYIQGLMVQ